MCQAFAALCEVLTVVLPESSAAWGHRGDACARMPMAASIAADFFEKAESLARADGDVDAAAGFAAKREAVTAKFLASLEMASASLERMAAGQDAAKVG